MRRILSRLLKRFLQNRAVTVLAGPLRGWKWWANSGNHSYWIGIYESVYARIFSRQIKAGMTVVDIGAHSGYFSLIASRNVGLNGAVFSFEPNPINLSNFRKNLALNNCNNIVISESAVGHKTGTTKFLTSCGSFFGHIDESGDSEVAIVSVDDFFLERDSSVDVIKIDVEGNEYWVLRGAERTVKANTPIIFVATHGPKNYERTLLLLENWGYETTMIGKGNEKNAEFIAVPRKNTPAARSAVRVGRCIASCRNVSSRAWE